MDSVHEEALEFIDKVEETFFHSDDYDKRLDLFLSALETHNKGADNAETLVKTIKNLLQGHEDLLSWYTNKFEPKFVQTQTQNHMELNEESCKSTACNEFLKKVNDRFPEVDNDTYNKVLEAVDSIYRKVSVALKDHENEKKTKKTALNLIYTELCTLLLGHPDLLREFHAMMKLGAGEETKLEYENMLQSAKEDIMYNVDLELEQYRLTIKAVKEGAKKFSAINRRCIERMYLMHCKDNGKRVLMNDFVRKMKEDPRGVSKAVLPHMKMKERELSRKKKSVGSAFKQVFSHPI